MGRYSRYPTDLRSGQLVTRFECATGTFQLERRPPVAGDQLLAHDAADALLLEHVGRDPGRSLVVNDAFGALAVALHDTTCVSWSDSKVAHLATVDNLTANGLAADVELLPSTEMPAGQFDTVLWRLPRSTDVLRAQVDTLGYERHGRVLAGGMDKHLPASFLAYLREHGSVTVLPGKRKAHVYDIAFDGAPATGHDDPLVSELGFELAGGPHVFGRDRVDHGSRLLIDVLEQVRQAATVADLACGTGVLGIALQRVQPNAAVHYFDESYQAVAASRVNVERNIGTVSNSYFECTDGFGDTTALFDAVLCNPPFHQGNTVADSVALDLFHQASARLASRGELWVVGNGHLRYGSALRSIVGPTRQVAANAKFVVVVATKA
jgi:23S rRNA (guanine1835-N2)-methyltransferase